MIMVVAEVLKLHKYDLWLRFYENRNNLTGAKIWKVTYEKKYKQLRSPKLNTITNPT